MTATARNLDSPDVVADLIGKIAAIGPNFDETILGKTRDLYAPLLANQATAGVTVTADIEYGSDPRQKLDLYRPANAQRAPVLVYIPGGGFVGGDKNSDGLFYGNLGNYFARHGILTAVANYRLAPDHAYPAGPEDVGGAVAWARANAASHGGDPSRLIVWGQSAGSTHVATYLFNPQFKAAGICAAILMSGPYKITGPLRPNMEQYFGSDKSQYPSRSPLTFVNNSRVPLMLSVAEFDPGFLAEPTFELAAAVTRRDGKAPQFAFMAGHNHVSTVMSIGTAHDDVGQKVRDFIGGL